MARPGGYGRMSNNRRGSGAVWQWLLLGSLFGFGCAAILVLTLLTFDILSISSNDDEGQPVAQATLPLQPTQSAPPTTPLPTENVQATVQAAIDATGVAMQATDAAAEQAAAPGEAVTVATVGIPTQPAVATEEVQDPVVDAGSAGAQTTDPVTEPETTEDGGQDTDSAAGGGGSETDTDAQVAEPADEPAEEEPAIDPILASVVSELVAIEGGTFNMGTTAQEVAASVRECIDRDGGDCQASYGEDATPQVTVTLSDFAIERTEVSNAQYIEFLNSLIRSDAGLTHENGCNAPSGVLCVETSVDNDNDLSSILFDGLNYSPTNPVINQLPVVGVTWYGAQAYCEAIGRRLPTEAEWEYAAGNGTTENLYPWGGTWINAEDYARTSRPDPANIGVVQIGSYPDGATVQGVVDMAGNAEEWVADWYSATWYSDPNASALDPTGPVAGRDKVLRGGSWAFPPFFTRTVQRRHETPDWISFTAGFRCAADIEEEEPAVDAPVDGGSTGEVDTADASTGGSEVESLATQAPAAGATIRPAATLELPATATAEGTEAAVPPVQDGG